MALSYYQAWRARMLKHRPPMYGLIVIALTIGAITRVAHHDPLWRIVFSFVVAGAWAFIWWVGRKPPHSA